ncbi:MAG: Na(+)-translocating NADH-quinone reductase subunit A [Runella sp.]
MGKKITIRKGYDIRLEGKADYQITDLPASRVVALKPPDFSTIVPRLSVDLGQEVLAGQPLFHDKNNPRLLFCSPVSGEVVEIVRGEKRRIMEVRVMPDREIIYQVFPKGDVSKLNKAQITERLLESGCWPYIRQRPYSTIARPEDTPKAIFVSCFDSAPLAPDLDFIIEQERIHFELGIKALSLLAEGNLHLCTSEKANPKLLADNIKYISTEKLHYFKGPHPAGNVGVQIHHIAPIQKGEVVWYVHPQDVVIIGRLFGEGRYRAHRLVALTGSCIKNPQYLRVVSGQSLHSMLEHHLKDDACRLIQGNVLTGQKTHQQDFLSFYTNHLTAIPEGREPEFLGWLLPGFHKLSLSRTFFSWLTPNRSYVADTNMHGEERAFVMSGQYDKVLPMNIYPVHLLKAILAKDIERMEQLGIYEVAEEDFALCEFVCTSKINVQRIISEGLAYIRQEA